MVLFADAEVSRGEGMFLFAALLVYLWRALTRPGSHVEPEGAAPPVVRAGLVALTGLAAVLVGAHLLVDAATEIARDFGVSEAVIGLTIVAIGTSLPELATTIAAAVRGQRDIALGNVIGSNIFNVFGILGVTALVGPLPVSPRFLDIDVPVLLAVSLAVCCLSAITGRIPRATGAVALFGYALYVGFGARI
jgi:cation:H+ antiporter